MVNSSPYDQSSNSQRRGLGQKEVLIAVMGATGSGKSTFINLVSRSQFQIGKGLKSCTETVDVAPPFTLDGFSVTLIDTPGFDDTTKSDTEILTTISAFLSTAYENGVKLAGVIYIHRISDVRMSGIATRNFRLFRNLCGDTTLRNVVIVTNMWSKVSLEEGEAREAELASQDMFFKPVLDKNGQLVRHDNTLASAQAILQLMLRNHPMALRIQRELVDEKRDISLTAAGKELGRELAEQAERHLAELQKIRQEMVDAIRDKDEETRKELEQEQRKLQNEIHRVQSDSQRLAYEYGEEKQKLEQRMQEMRDQAMRDVERAREDYERRVSEYENRMRDSANASAAEKAEIMRQLEDMQRQLNENRGGGCVIQ